MVKTIGLLGGLHSAKIIMHSVDFAEIEQFQATGQWDVAGQKLAAAAAGLEQSGADMVQICTNRICCRGLDACGPELTKVHC